MQYEIGDKVELTNGSIVEIISYANSLAKEEGYIVKGDILITPDKIVRKII
jgi:hypothetical protein